MSESKDLRERAIERASVALERTKERNPSSTPPRIEIIRRQARSAADLVILVLEHLETIRDLAYDRQKAAERLAVRGGSRDYALDNNGDPRARELYQQAAWELLDLVEDSTVIAHDLTSFLKTGTINRGRRRTTADITGEELEEALEARRRRIARGEGEAATEVQPWHGKRPTVSQLQQQVKALTGILAKLHPRLTKAERSRLTPREAAAWGDAVPLHLRGPRSFEDIEAHVSSCPLSVPAPACKCPVPDQAERRKEHSGHYDPTSR